MQLADPARSAATAATSALGRRRRFCREFGRRFHQHARPPHRRTVEPESLAVSDFVAENFFGLVDAVVVRVEQDARMILFLGHHEATLAVERHDNVAVVLVRGIDALDCETGQRAELHACHCLRHQARLVRRLTFRSRAQHGDAGQCENRSY